jgi:hypothetical protein
MRSTDPSKPEEAQKEQPHSAKHIGESCQAQVMNSAVFGHRFLMRFGSRLLRMDVAKRKLGEPLRCPEVSPD